MNQNEKKIINEILAFAIDIEISKFVEKIHNMNEIGPSMSISLYHLLVKRKKLSTGLIS